MSGGQAASRRSTLLEPTRRLIDIRRTTHRLARSKADMRIADARNHSRYGIMVHCAHGKGRSTCVMVACLVRAGVYATWQDAFEACAKRRKGVKLNGKMRRALDEWAKLSG